MGGHRFDRTIQFCSLNCNAGNRLLRYCVVFERSHPTVPNIEKSPVIVSHVCMVVVVMRDVVEASKQPVTRHPAWDHLVAGVTGDVDHGIVRKIR